MRRDKLVPDGKQLEQGGFRWQSMRDGVILVMAAQMAVLLQGSD